MRKKWVKGSRLDCEPWGGRGWPEVVGGGGSTAEQRWRRSSFKSGEFRRARAGAAGPGSFTGGRRRRAGARLGQCGGVEVSLAWRSASSAMAEEAERWKR